MILNVTDKDSMFVGKVEARVGLKTQAGTITRMTDKTIWCVGKSGFETMYRLYDGRPPSVSRRFAGKDFIPKEQTP